MDRELEYWKVQASYAFEEIDKLSVGIARIYELLGHTEKFEVAHNPAHNQLAAIISGLEKRSG